MSAEPEKLRSYIKQAADSLGISQSELFRRANVTPQGVSYAVDQGACGRKMALRLQRASDGRLQAAVLCGFDPIPEPQGDAA